MLTPFEMLQVLAAGGSLVISSSGKPAATLIQLAQAAAASGAHLTIHVTTPLPVLELVQIAEAGQGRVTFNLTV